MNQDSSKDLIIRFSWPVKISVLLVTAAALFAFVPLALEAVPEEALGPMVAFLAIPLLFAYLSIVVFTYRIQIAPDRIATEAFPSPFLRSEQCLLAEISAIEKDKWWSTLSIYRYKKPAPFRITPLELREAGPIEILNAVQARIGRDIFLERVTGPLRRIWNWHKLLINAIFLLVSAWLSLQLLEVGGEPDIPDAVRGIVLGGLFIAAILIASVDWFLYRSLNRE
ncbi:MAG: hypothetical protein JW748_01670 [Anaerolineales bacterium]|nr:hypothetical protein [Anaerolineales bacterium]